MKNGLHGDNKYGSKNGSKPAGRRYSRPWKELWKGRIGRQLPAWEYHRERNGILLIEKGEGERSSTTLF